MTITGQLYQSMTQKFLAYFAIVFILSFHTVHAQSKEVRFLIDTTLTIMKKNSVNADKIDWEQLHKEALEKAKKINDPYQLGPVMRHILQTLNEFHGAFFYGDSTFKWQRNEPPVSDSLMNEWKKGVHIKTLMLENNIGYLRVPFMSYAGKARSDSDAQRLNDSLCYLLNKNVKGVILDLRLNGGGNMYPMMLGLEQLEGTGKIGTFIGDKGESWYIKDHNFMLDTMMLASIVPKCAVNTQDLPVVVLVGRGTGSSGEFLTMSLKGRDNTVFIGNKTAGYVTVISGIPINDSAYLYLSVGYGADRKGNIYKDVIEPDISIEEPDSFNDLANDEKVKAGIKWIVSHSR